MPFASKKQMKWMFANKPSMAKRWAKHTPDISSLPESTSKSQEKKAGDDETPFGGLTGAQTMGYRFADSHRASSPLYGAGYGGLAGALAGAIGGGSIAYLRSKDKPNPGKHILKGMGIGALGLGVPGVIAGHQLGSKAWNDSKSTIKTMDFVNQVLKMSRDYGISIDHAKIRRMAETMHPGSGVIIDRALSKGAAYVSREKTADVDLDSYMAEQPLSKKLSLGAYTSFGNETPYYGAMFGGTAGAGIGSLGGGLVGYLRSKKGQRLGHVLSHAGIGGLAGAGIGGVKGYYMGRQALNDTKELMLGAIIDKARRMGSRHIDTLDIDDSTKALLHKGTSDSRATDFIKKYLGKKQASVKSAKTRNDLDKWLANASHHPSTITGTMQMPLKAWKESMGIYEDSHMDIAKKNREKAEKQAMSIRELLKADFLLKCARANLTLDQIEKELDRVIEKKGGIGAGIGAGLGFGALGATKLYHGIGDLMGATLIGAPIVAGGLTGYALGRGARDANPEKFKKEELRDTYLRLADEAKRRSLIRRMQEEHPGSIVQIS